MTVLMFAAVALVGYRLWMRVREAETTIEKLTARVTVLDPHPERLSAAARFGAAGTVRAERAHGHRPNSSTICGRCLAEPSYGWMSWRVGRRSMRRERRSGRPEQLRSNLA